MPDVVCSPNAAVTYDFLVGRGLRDYQAAAVVGNLQVESRLDPHLAATDTNGLPSRGIAMWQPPRWQNLLAFAGGRDPWDLGVQLEFLWHELESDASLGLDALRTSSDITRATTVFQDMFERPARAYAHTDRRIAAAQSALYSCPAIVPPTPAPVPSKRIGVIGKVVGFAAAVTAIGYGTYRLLSQRPERRVFPRPSPPPDPTYPMFRRYE